VIQIAEHGQQSKKGSSIEATNSSMKYNNSNYLATQEGYDLVRVILETTPLMIRKKKKMQMRSLQDPHPQKVNQRDSDDPR
jgi:hypothetical protein